MNLLEAYVPVLPNGRRSRSITLSDGEEARNIDFTLARGGVITGRLTGADGGPIIGARVLANPIANDAENAPIEDQSRLAAWDNVERAKLRNESQALKQDVELRPCQQMNDYLLRASANSR